MTWHAVTYRSLCGVLENVQREKDAIVAAPYSAAASRRLEELDAIEADVWDAIEGLP